MPTTDEITPNAMGILPKEHLLKSIEALDLSMRAHNALRRNGIHTISAFMDVPEDALWQMRNIGRKTVEEILFIRRTIADRFHVPGQQDYPETEGKAGSPVQSPDARNMTTAPAAAHAAAQASEQAATQAAAQADAHAAMVQTNARAAVLKGHVEKILFRQVPIETVGLSTRSFNALKAANVQFVSDLLGWTVSELKALPNLGIKCINEIMAVVSRFREEAAASIQADTRPDDADPAALETVKGILSLVHEDIKDMFATSHDELSLLLLEPVSAKVASGNGGTASQYCEDAGFLAWLFRQPILEKAVKGSLCTIVEADPHGISPDGLTQGLPALFRRSGLLQPFLDELSEAGVLAHWGGRVIMNRLTLEQYLQSIQNERNRSVAESWLGGKTFEAIAVECGLSRERIRQILLKVLSRRPPLREDVYIKVFEKYSWPRDPFMAAFNEPLRTYRYLKEVASSGLADWSGLADDVGFPEEFRSAARLLPERLAGRQPEPAMVPEKPRKPERSKPPVPVALPISELAEQEMIASQSVAVSANGRRTATPFGRLAKRIQRGFPNRRLVGDIEINDDEFQMLIQYLRCVLSHAKQAKGQPVDDPLLCVTLVQIGIRYYDSSYWEHVERILNSGTLSMTIRAWLGESCIHTLSSRGKALADAPDRVSTILMHGFVSDRYASNLFTYLFAYYRIDLERDLERNDRAAIRVLLDAMIRHEDGRTHWVVQQTADAVACHRAGCNARIRRLLRLIDASFWGDDLQRNSSNRLTRLFYEWREGSKEFSEESNRYRGGPGSAGKKAFSSPYLHCRFEAFSSRVVLPAQIVKFSDAANVHWQVRFPDRVATVACDVYEAVTGRKTEEVHLDIADGDLFADLEITLFQGEEKVRTFRIPAEPIRFFSKAGDQVPAQSIGTGESYALSPARFKPVSDALVETQNIRGMAFAYFDFQLGDIVQLPDGQPISIGKKIEEGLMHRGLVEQVQSRLADRLVPVYHDSPSVLLKILPQRLKGSAVHINGKPWHLSNGQPLNEIEIGDRSGEKGYLIHLSDFGCAADGLYEIRVDVPNDRTNRTWSFALIQGFRFEFEDSPYLFAHKGTVRFASALRVKPAGAGIEVDPEPNTFNFEIAAERDTLAFLAGNLPVEIPVPMLAYRLGIGDWFTQQPPEIWHSDFPVRIGIRYPADRLTLAMDMSDLEAEEDQEITFEKSKASGQFECDVTRFRSWFSRDRQSNQVMLRVQGRELPFLKVITRSKVVSATIKSDFESGYLIGDFEIVGKSNYYADIEFNDTPVAEKVPIVNGSLRFASELRSGEYAVVVFEDEEDDSGFGDNAYHFLKLCRCGLVNPTDLRGKHVGIKCLKKGEANPFGLFLNGSYTIRSLRRIEESDKYRYVGDFVHNGRMHVSFRVQLTIGDLSQLKYATLAVLDEYGDASELLYDAKKGEIVREEERGLRPSEKYRRYACLFDDEYVFGIEFVTLPVYAKLVR